MKELECQLDCKATAGLRDEKQATEDDKQDSN